MSLPASIIAVLRRFESAFTQPTWRKLLTLLEGTLLAHGRRTIAAALRHMDLADDATFSRFHHVLNRARWSPLVLSRRLLALICATFAGPSATLTIVVDEHLERRWGRQIRQRGHYRDSARSSREQSVSSSGLRWIVVSLVVQPAWTTRSWALPFLVLSAPSPAVSATLGVRHRTVPERMQGLVRLIRRWVPQMPITVVGDGTYSVVELGHTCQQHAVTLVAPLRLDANLYAPPPARTATTMGRPRVVGARLPKLSQVLTDPATAWQALTLPWYDQGERTVAVCTGTAMWYSGGQAPLPLRWVLVRDPAGRHDPKALFTTDQTAAVDQVLRTYMQRWTLEVTFEESRAHLGINTQRQWSDLAIARSTPLLFGLYSLVAVFGQVLHPAGDIPVPHTAWYAKTAATFGDVLATLRRRCWRNFTYLPSPDEPDLVLVPKQDVRRFAYAICSTF